MEGLVCLGVVVSLVMGIGSGMALQHKRQAVKAHAAAAEALPGLRQTARGARLRQLLWFVGTACAVGLILAVLVRSVPD